MSGMQPKRKSRGKLLPLDWREMLDDGALKGNLSTLYVRPTGPVPEYVSDEARQEIVRRGTGGMVPITAVALPVAPEETNGGKTSPDVIAASGDAVSVTSDVLHASLRKGSEQQLV